MPSDSSSSIERRWWQAGRQVLPRQVMQRCRAGLVSRRLRTFGPAIIAGQGQLHEFGQISGEEFSALAEHLGVLDTRLAEVRSQTAKLDATLHDHDEDRALHSAFQLFRNFVDLTHASIGIALSQEEQMEQMEGNLLKNRDHLAQNSLLFRVLVMSIRTEAARIDPDHRAIFNSVAGEIDAMERQLNTTVETAFTQIEEIVHEAAGGRQQLQQLQQALHARAHQSIELLRGELEMIKGGLAPCTEVCRKVSQLLDDARAQTGELIVALQYQDIVRQQLEHVGAGFDDIHSHLQPGAAPGTALDPAYVHHAALVQRKHLLAAERTIGDASKKIQSGSRDLLKTAAALIEGFAQIEGATEGIFKNSKLGQLFRQETNHLMLVAEQTGTTNERIARLLQRIEESVTEFSTRIRHHELEVKIVALNSQIAAALMPNAGALNKLAEETARQAGETAAITQALSAELGATLTRLQGIRQEAEDVRKTLGTEKRDLSEGSITVGKKLDRLNTRIQRSAGDMSENFRSAYSRVGKLLPELQFPALLATCFVPAGEVCERLLAATADFAPIELAEDSAARLATHRSRYTMRAERDVHDAAESHGVMPSALSVPSGDIDLFDSAPADPVPATADRPEPAPGKEATPGIELF